MSSNLIKKEVENKRKVACVRNYLAKQIMRACWASRKVVTHDREQAPTVIAGSTLYRGLYRTCHAIFSDMFVIHEFDPDLVATF